MLPFRRQRSLRRRVTDAARNAPQRAPDLHALRAAAAQLDVPWGRSLPARFVRERFMQFVLNPVLDYYTARRATGRETLSALKQPVILVANHASHIDTPLILSALPRKLRKRTAVGAAADYFYRNRVTASLVSLIFNTVPIERKGGGGLTKNGGHLDSLLEEGWNLLLYPEGTRSRGGVPGRVRRGAAVLALAHNLAIIPIRITGTANAMPPGRLWPRRMRGWPLPKRHRVEISFGEPIPPNGDAAALIERVQSFLYDGEGPTLKSPYRSRDRKREARPTPGPTVTPATSGTPVGSATSAAPGTPGTAVAPGATPTRAGAVRAQGQSSPSASQSVERATASHHLR